MVRSPASGKKKARERRTNGERRSGESIIARIYPSWRHDVSPIPATPHPVRRSMRRHGGARRTPGSMIGRRVGLATTDDMGRAIADAALDSTLSPGHTVVIGGSLDSLPP